MIKLPSLRAHAFVVATAAVMTALSAVSVAGTASTPKAEAADAALDAALAKIVALSSGPPGIVAVVQRGDEPVAHIVGKADLATGAAPTVDDHMRVASVTKAFSGAVELSAVADGSLELSNTIGARVPGLPAAWSKITLAQLLAHTSGIPDFSKTKEFGASVGASLLVPPPPIDLLSPVADKPLLFKPGAKYAYSNSDNIIAALMVEQATGNPFSQELLTRVAEPLALAQTTLPNDATLPTPSIHGYELASPDSDENVPEDVTELFAAGWAFASGGIVSTPHDSNAFVRGYVAGTTTNRATQKAQFTFRPGSSEPPGPGTNNAGLAIFRYKTRCGTVYGHTGNTPGYTQFISATRDGSRSATVSVNAQITPGSDAKTFTKLRNIFELAVCAAVAKE